MPTWAPPSPRAGRLAPSRHAAAAAGHGGRATWRRRWASWGASPRCASVSSGAWRRGEDAGQRGEGGGMDARPQASDVRAARQQGEGGKAWGEGCKDGRPQGGGARARPEAWQGGRAASLGTRYLQQGHVGAQPCWLGCPTRPLSGRVTRWSGCARLKIKFF